MDESIARFWHNYNSKTATCNVPNHAQLWYVKHVEDYIKVHPDHLLAETGPDDATHYLEEIGKKLEFRDWKLWQVAGCALKERNHSSAHKIRAQTLFKGAQCLIEYVLLEVCTYSSAYSQMVVRKAYIECCVVELFLA